MPEKSEINNYSSDDKSNEVECVNKIRSGDSSAFEELFNLYCQQLINFARRYVLDKQIAENIVQDVFVSIWQSRTNLDPSKMIKAYLFTAVKNNSLKHLRHLKIENKGIDDSPTYIYDDERPDKKLDEKEVELKIHHAINELPEKCREIFKMNRFENLKYAEIAEILDISIKTVETQMGRALKKLRDRLNRI
jgi:RNA polymerase sigma-70 factor (ECF subfamily)